MTGIISPLEESTPESIPFDDLVAVRELVLQAHADVVPELVQGESIEALLASVGPAQSAYARIAGSVRPTTPAVPAGGNPPVVVDVERLPAAEKIRRGLAASRG